MKNLICFVTAAVLLIVGDTASAQAPTYAPYGAWRGRIRYVEGPWRTRSTIHWGNGITPVGGQVLIQGLTSAENVLTNPDFLSKLSGLRDAEANKAAEARSAEITSTIGDIRAQNAEIAKLNQSVLTRWGLEPTKLEAVVQASQPPSPFDPNADEAPSALTDKIKAISARISPLVDTSKKQLEQALRDAESLAQTADKLTLSDQHVVNVAHGDADKIGTKFGQHFRQRRRLHVEVHPTRLVASAAEPRVEMGKAERKNHVGSRASVGADEQERWPIASMKGSNSAVRRHRYRRTPSKM